MAIILFRILEVYIIMVFAASLSAALDPYRTHKISRFLFNVTDPLLKHLRKLMPPLDNFDTAPFGLILILMIIDYMLRKMPF